MSEATKVAAAKGAKAATAKTATVKEAKPIDPAVAKLMKQQDITESQAKEVIKYEKKLTTAEAKAIAKYGKGSGYMINGVAEERDIVKGSIKFVPNSNGVGGKMVVTIKCLDTQEERDVATSDLQNVARSVEAQKAFLSERRKTKRTTMSSADAAELVSAL